MGGRWGQRPDGVTLALTAAEGPVEGAPLQRHLSLPRPPVRGPDTKAMIPPREQLRELRASP